MIGWIWAIAAIPRRIYRLEVEERIRHVDSQLIERQHFEALKADFLSFQDRFNALSLENAYLKRSVNDMLHQIMIHHTQLEALSKEIKSGVDALSKDNTLQLQLQSIYKEINTSIDTLSTETRAALQVANQNIIHANVKLDETGIFNQQCSQSK